MSVISNRHNVVPFVAGKTAPFPTQRLAKVGYKTTAKQKAKFANVAASVPVIEEQVILDNAHRMVPYIRSIMENAQDGILRSLYETSGGTLSSIGDDDLSIESVLGYLSAEQNGGRLTKELIADWFTEHVADSLTVVVAEKLGFVELNETEMGVINKQLAMFSGLVQSLAGGKNILSAQQKSGCRKVIELADDAGNKVSEQLSNRLDAMDRKELAIEELLDL